MEEVIDGDSDPEAVLHSVVKTRKRRGDKSNWKSEIAKK